MKDVPSLQRLTGELCRLPGVGPKTAERLAYFVLRSSEPDVQRLSEALTKVKAQVKACPQCFAFTESESLCAYCADATRHDHILCVVEQPMDVARIDAAGVFKGRYHVLHGALSPLEGIGPGDIKAQALLQRVKPPSLVQEVVLATDADIEGDTTALYLAGELARKGLKVTRLARGVPVGGGIDYIDRRTLGMALENRVLFECR